VIGRWGGESAEEASTKAEKSGYLAEIAELFSVGELGRR
jgi:hypothetical protein